MGCNYHELSLLSCKCIRGAMKEQVGYAGLYRVGKGI